MSKNYQKGFIALFSVIIISFVLLLITVTLNFSGLFSRFNILDSEFKAESENLASACLNVARLKIAQSMHTVGSVTKVSNVGKNTEFCEFIISNPPKITAHACVNNAHTFYDASYDPNTPDVTLNTLKELPNSTHAFSGCFYH